MFELNDGGSIYVSVINDDGTNSQRLHGGQFPQKTNSLTVIFRTAGNVKSINLDGTNYQELFPNYDRDTLKLSFDDSKIVGGKAGESGIWLINVDGTGFVKTR